MSLPQNPNAWDTMRASMAFARTQFSATDDVAGELAQMLVGRLRRGVRSSVLKKLKRELAEYNAHTDTWKN